jgi:hypothetical protein
MFIFNFIFLDLFRIISEFLSLCCKNNIWILPLDHIAPAWSNETKSSALSAPLTLFPNSGHLEISRTRGTTLEPLTSSTRKCPPLKDYLVVAKM